MIWRSTQDREALGFLPSFIHESDPRPARAQFHERYAHGGGWLPMRGWSLTNNRIQYPGDEPLEPIAWTELRDERIFVYPGAWVCVVQPSGEYEVARMD